MEIQREDVRNKHGRVIERVRVLWASFGFTRDFDHSDVADAYMQGLEDAQSAAQAYWKTETK